MISVGFLPWLGHYQLNLLASSISLARLENALRDKIFLNDEGRTTGFHYAKVNRIAYCEHLRKT